MGLFSIHDNLYYLGWILRIGLLCYGVCHDMNLGPSDVAFTDVDYYVLNDGARCIIYPGECCSLMSGNITHCQIFEDGKKFHSSPYNRDTYRYTPFLAYICMLNHLFSFVFQTKEQATLWIGKFVFISCDMLAVILMRSIQLECKDKSTKRSFFKVNEYALTMAWTLNPFVWTISTRGNAESVVCVLIVSWLFFLNKFINDGKHDILNLVLAAICYGLAVHVKIFPILYIVPFYFWIQTVVDASIFYPSKLFLCFSVVSGGVFCILCSTFYIMYGFDFLNGTYLYHITRLDHRHNFSLYFYYFYNIMSKADFTSSISLLERISSFVPQFVILIAVSYCYGKRNLPLSCFLITFMFVALNKVCTSQYFIWYWMFIPFINFNLSNLHNISMNRFSNCTNLSGGKVILIILCWLVPQALWLSCAYKLEFLGESVFYSLWMNSVIFFISNIWIAGEFCLNTGYKDQ